MDGSFRSQKTLLNFIQSCWWTSEVSTCKCSHLVAWKITRGKLGRMVWAAGKGLDQPYTSSRWATATAVGSRNPWPHRLLHLCQSNGNRGWLLLPKDRLCWYYPRCFCSSVLCQCTQVFLQAIHPHAHQGEEPRPWLPGCRGQKHGQKAREWSRCKNLKLSCCQISVSTGFVEPKPCLMISWQWDRISNSSRCSRQEQPPHQTSASKSLGPPLGSLNAFRDIWTHTFHLLTPTILLHMFILLWTPSKLESVERCFYGLRF